jgi:hypothetical protein
LSGSLEKPGSNDLLVELESKLGLQEKANAFVILSLTPQRFLEHDLYHRASPILKQSQPFSKTLRVDVR